MKRFISEHNLFQKLPVTEEEMYRKLRQEFNRNKNVTDLRVIDMLIFHVIQLHFLSSPLLLISKRSNALQLFQSRNDLREIGELWAQPCHVMGEHFRDTVNPVPKKFLDKFFSGPD